MTILTQLSAGTATEGELREPRGFLTTVHAEPAAGVHVKIMLGSAGLFLRRGEVTTVIPREELIKLAGQHSPLLTLGSPAATPLPPT